MNDSDDTPGGAVPSGAEFVAAEASPEFANLWKTLRRFVFPMTAFFLIWYAIYALLGAFAHDFMGKPVWGNINVGLILGLLQFVTTFAITALYIRFASDKLDPAAEVVRKNFADGVYLDGAAK
ncbi:MAG TPA: DUF485 domain-containing protein [Gordonia sp. (in: high G+C Gram-positive bacteria)]|uniref:DUF485 domain-containing protein n=1 Tax=unclassified Gordonia (in: high G+C Gram-positive bacteria) TaxID=2657482 RepID=UPI000F982294|nr:MULTISPECIES: DUF485 domain-containing protein [unclassified Gordonia (in: high G+C Gram-positive bacteria)]RUP36801.1 MAG: DUF485 domain-containing protein [Gordonia sp. (in: high G+C Gram-positive bacteria)]HNP58639.1 DUF485 domain-containing protein [Gordonia sp. (in: high G+C Gram-positive bacteria)]HRC52652.1 DUF485 domain-containing protein [Gordonia sp. (in: high G+C Gram-positive bacteria)]